MQVVRYTEIDRLAGLAGAWDRLARGVPFCSWTWLSAWWRHYADNCRAGLRPRRLFVLAVFDGAGRLAAIAPWYLEQSPWRGRVLRFLGSGDEVCSDYLTVLCEPGLESLVAAELAEWLARASDSGSCKPADESPDAWDMLEWAGVDAEDPIMVPLAGELAARGGTVHRRSGLNYWRIHLPPTWEDFLALLSKDHRKKLRHATRRLIGTGRVALHTVQSIDRLVVAREILIDLHQRRRQSLGEPGCFASARFDGFHREVMPPLLLAGQLQFHLVELDHRPVAAEYQLAGDGVMYAYQSGVEPEALRCSPGRLAHLLTIRRAIEQGYRAFDFLRGDEPYKVHWRAEPRATVEVRIAAPRASARVRHSVWLAADCMKQWLKKV